MRWCQIDKPSSTEIFKKILLRLSTRHCPLSSHGACEDRPLLRWLSCPGCLLLVAQINKQQVCWRCCCCLERRLPAAASSSRAAAPASLLRREGPSFPPPSCSNLLPPFPLSQPPTFLGGIIQKKLDLPPLQPISRPETQKLVFKAFHIFWWLLQFKNAEQILRRNPSHPRFWVKSDLFSALEDPLDAFFIPWMLVLFLRLLFLFLWMLTFAQIAIIFLRQALAGET